MSVDAEQALGTDLPPEVAAATSGYLWHPVDVGQSAAHVYRLDDGTRAPRYLKVYATVSGLGRPLLAEVHRLHWLQGKIPVPSVLLFCEHGGRDWLLMSGISGHVAFDRRFQDDIPGVVCALADGLKMLHALQIDDCPFGNRLSVMFAEARRRTQAGLVDETNFDAHRVGRSADDLLLELEATMPPSEDLVFTHGDYCLPNVLVEDGRVSGFIDVGSAGAADRYQDLALVRRSLIRNWGPQWAPLLFDEYGIEPDPAKLEFYQLLDEFF